MTKKDMEIRYKMNNNQDCFTSCPFDNTYKIKVASSLCHFCKSFKDEDESNNIIYCQKQGELTQKLKEKYVETVTKIMEDKV